ncbi:MAG TPA: 3-carboxy-cis,cis-muconate cycloisomerase [Xanthobacteraceae bacterium]|nr:3-carboxy-cis,cis-muconate cycloisomerase [Xanthobacteraceae bacterium]
MTETELAASPLLAPLFATVAMRALHADRAVIARMLEVEAALARAEAAEGVIPRKAVAAIKSACDPARFDPAALGKSAALAGNIAIPLVKALTAEVAKRDREAARYVHWGATSQDIIDTAAVVAIGESVALLDRDLVRAIKAFAKFARKHRRTPLAARTWLQQALPTIFGLKLANWAALVSRARENLHDAAAKAAVLQFGGAAGTLAALGKKGVKVANRLAEELDLRPSSPWHAERDRIANVASAVGILIGASGKVARDVSLLMQTEVAELFEPAGHGRGGSSTMPHKRNPIACAQILAAANLAPGLVSAVLSGMVQEHERALGGWQAEWLVIPELFLLASGVASRLAEIAEGMEIDSARMRANLDATHGLIMGEAVQMALGVEIGRLQAHDLLETASEKAAKERRPLIDVLSKMPEITKVISRDKLMRLFDPLTYLGSAESFLDRTLSSVEKSLTHPSPKSKRKR